MDDKYGILIIDDEKIVLESCKEILVGSDYRLETAYDGIIGLEMLEDFRPDLVFVDLKMPGITGLEVLEKVRAFDPTIVTIVITGYATISSAVEAMKKGAFDFLTKPFTPDEFRLTTQRGLDNRRLVLETIALKREKELLRENFAAIVSHELKAPLGAVQQNLYVLAAELDNDLNESQRDRIERMKSRITGLVELIHTWLRVISTDLESIKDDFEPTSLPIAIMSAVESITPHAVRKDIEIVTTIEEPLSPVYGEEGTLTEVFVNLGNNAVKYSYPGGMILIDAKESEGLITISVSDTGVGIPEDDLPFIFDDFYGGKPGASGEIGYGLGLAICQRIIDLHDGSITVRSELGRGTTFEIKLMSHEDEPQPQPALQHVAISSL